MEFLRKEFFFKGKMYSVCAMDKKTLNEELRKLRDKIVLEYKEQKQRKAEEMIKHQVIIDYKSLIIRHLNKNPEIIDRMRIKGVDMDWATGGSYLYPKFFWKKF